VERKERETLGEIRSIEQSKPQAEGTGWDQCH
jgi:hypothetical protein